MNIDITRLKNHNVDYIDINETYSFTKEELQNSNILELENVKIIGRIMNNDKDYMIELSIEGIMKLEDSITLEPVDYEFKTEIDGNIQELLEEIGETSKKSEFSIDIFPIIWENILMEIPIKVVGSNTYNQKLEGNGWRFITEEDRKTTNPELEKLKDLLK